MKKQMILLTLLLATPSTWASWSSPVYERMCYFNQSANDETKPDLFPCRISQSGQPVSIHSNENVKTWSNDVGIDFNGKTIVFYQKYSAPRDYNPYFSPKSDLTVQAMLDGKPAEHYLQNSDHCYRSEEWDICIHQPNLMTL